MAECPLQPHPKLDIYPDPKRVEDAMWCFQHTPKQRWAVTQELSKPMPAAIVQKKTKALLGNISTAFIEKAYPPSDAMRIAAYDRE